MDLLLEALRLFFLMYVSCTKEHRKALCPRHHSITSLPPPPPLFRSPVLVAIVDIGGSSAPDDRASRQADSETLQLHRILPSYYLLYSYLHNWLINRRTAFHPRLFLTAFI